MSRTWMPCVLVLGIMVAGASRLPAEKAVDGAGNGGKVAVVREWGGSNARQEVASRVVVTDQQGWEAAWFIMYGNILPKPETPVIDFTEHMAIAVFMGQQSTGGYGTRITNIEDKDKRVVSVRERRPPPGACTASAMTSPFHVVVVPKTDKAVEFVRLADAAGPEALPVVPQHPLALTKADNGRTHTVKAGQTIVLSLKGNITTGYGWDVDKLDGTSIVPVGEIEYLSDANPEGMDGRGGVFKAKFKADRPGTTIIRLKHWSPFAEDEEPFEIFTATLVVER